MTTMPKIPTWLRWIGVALVCAGLAYALAGCAGLPRTVYDAAGAERQEIPYFVPGTNVEAFSAAPAGTGEPVGVDWLTLGLQVIGGLTGTSGLLAALSPAGRRTLGVVADPDASWKSTARALGNVATFGTIKPPAAPAQGV